MFCSRACRKRLSLDRTKPLCLCHSPKPRQDPRTQCSPQREYRSARCCRVLWCRLFKMQCQLPLSSKTCLGEEQTTLPCQVLPNQSLSPCVTCFPAFLGGGGGVRLCAAGTAAHSSHSLKDPNRQTGLNPETQLVQDWEGGITKRKMSP